MAREAIYKGAIHTAVLNWMKKNNIDPNLVQGYIIKRTARDLPIIEVHFYFDDAPTWS